MAKAITKAGERIEKPVDVKLNVLPIFAPSFISTLMKDPAVSAPPKS